MVVGAANEPVRLTADGLSADRGLVFSPDGLYLATASTKDFVYIWSVQDGSLLARLPGHSESALWFTWSPDSTMLLTVAYGPRGAAYLWVASSFKPQNTQYQRGQLARTVEQTFSAAWSPDGQTILLGDARGTVFAYGIPAR
jgi:WD40 repeat protein